MRVIAGKARGIPLVSPKGLHIRPTKDRVRESVFNTLNPVLEDADVLDLFCGTGANGIEALSRGARFCLFVDQSRDVIALVERNLIRTGLESRGRTLRAPLPQQLATIESTPGGFALVYVDPPYNWDGHSSLLESIHSNALLSTTGWLLIEHATAQPPCVPAPFNLMRRNRYGRTSVSFYRTESR